MTDSDPQSLFASADRAAANGDFNEARRLLERGLASGGDAQNWMKLAAMARASGDLVAAMTATTRALESDPFDFFALLGRASLLQRMGDPGAGEAWGHALAQRPAGLPPQLADVIAEAEARHAAHVASRENALLSVLADPKTALSDAERSRVARFASNASRRTRVYHSEPTDYHYPGLVEREFHDRADFPWIEALEAQAPAIAAEFAAVANAERAELVPYIQYDRHRPLSQWRDLNHSRSWTAIHLKQNGQVIAANARHCPQTMAAIGEIPQPVIPGCSPNAMFSLLAPHTTIPPHSGVSNTRLVCHLPLIVPDGCWFRVGSQTRPWRSGDAFVFDDSIEHEAANPSDDMRVVFIIDIWHPGLSEAERGAVTAMMDKDISHRAEAR